MSRSLKVAPDKINRVKQALTRCGFPNQQALAHELGIARATVSKFLNGKNVDFAIFEAVCNKLGLDWHEVLAYYEKEDTPIETGQFPKTLDKPSEAEAVSTPHLDGAMVLTSPQPKEEFIEAASNWNLELLYAELEVAKRKLGLNRRWGLTAIEKLYLRGLLCGDSPDEIADKLKKDKRLVRVQLSKGLYRYVEKLLNRSINSLENWRDILIWLAEAGYKLDNRFEQTSQNATIDIDALVHEVREKIKGFILIRCSNVKVLSMLKSADLERIYIDLKFLEEMPERSWIGIDAIKQNFNPGSQNLYWRFRQGSIPEQLRPGIEAAEHYDKLMIWGNAGAGKTTFLKHLAIQCIEKKFQSNRIPIFISLNEFAKTPQQPDLLAFIKQMFAEHKVSEEQITNLLNQGRILILLDGFDEVKEKEDSDRVLVEIRNLLNHFYKNRFVLACRLAGTEYGFPEFTEVEIADFDDEQIAQFAKKWFAARRKKTETAAKFRKQLEFDKSIKELATNPLLLTMLCLVFEENAEFPKKRFDLYKEAIDILLIKWDVSRAIERPQVYQKLELRGKRDLLSHIASKTFEEGKYFFEKEELEQYIADFIGTLPDAQTNPEALQEDSEKVLKAIVKQYGLLVERAREIYSFSHITIQEYFTARKIINSSNPEVTIKAWKNLVKHITESRWREVFILAVGALKSADDALNLMKEQVDAIVAKDDNLQEFLMWVNQQSLLVEVSYKKTGVRAFYLDADIDIDPGRKLGCAIDFNCTAVLAYASFLARPLGSDLTSMLNYAQNHDLSCVNDDALEIAFSSSPAIDTLIEIGTNLEPEMKKTLEKLQAELPDKNGDMESKLNWSKTHGKAWNEQVKELIVKPHRMGHHYSKLSEEQKELLKQYYEANLLLVECLNIANMSPQVRSEIMDNLLLPITEIEQREM